MDNISARKHALENVGDLCSAMPSADIKAVIKLCRLELAHRTAIADMTKVVDKESPIVSTDHMMYDETDR